RSLDVCAQGSRQLDRAGPGRVTGHLFLVTPGRKRGLMADTGDKTARRIPWFLLLALACKVAWMAWIQWQGCLPAQSDSVCFKQPAYMRLHTPYYSIPSYAGLGPDVDKLNSYPAAIYSYVNYAAFRCFGFSNAVSIAVDLTIHLL